MNHLSSVFELLDKDKDGVLSGADVRHLFAAMGIRLSDEDTSRLVALMTGSERAKNADKSTFVERMSVNGRTEDLQEEIMEGWRVLNPENSGTVSAPQVKDLLEKIGVMLTDEEAGELILQHDRSSKGGLSFDEFSSMFA